MRTNEIIYCLSSSTFSRLTEPVIMKENDIGQRICDSVWNMINDLFGAAWSTTQTLIDYLIVVQLLLLLLFGASDVCSHLIILNDFEWNK